MLAWVPPSWCKRGHTAAQNVESSVSINNVLWSGVELWQVSWNLKKALNSCSWVGYFIVTKLFMFWTNTKHHYSSKANVNNVFFYYYRYLVYLARKTTTFVVQFKEWSSWPSICVNKLTLGNVEMTSITMVTRSVV